MRILCLLNSGQYVPILWYRMEVNASYFHDFDSRSIYDIRIQINIYPRGSHNLKQNEAQSPCAESTNKGVNERSKDVT